MTKRVLVVAAIVIVVALGLALQKDQTPGMSMTVEQTKQFLDGDSTVVVLDVRSHEEFQSATGHLHGALLLPVQELATRMDELEQYKGRKLVVYCRTQNRSRRAVELLKQQGYNAVYVEGGITGWNAAQLPVVKEQP
jgi:rhodanese-related sulfurtransferase